MSEFNRDPLVDVEAVRRETTRLLGDPTLFPIEFLSWLKDYIAQSGITWPASSVISGSNSGSLLNLSAGIILPWAGPTIPVGALFCDGTAKSRATYARLFTQIGTTWGIGDGSTTFNIPDLRNRAPFGVGTTFPVLGAVTATGTPAAGTMGAAAAYYVITTGG